MTEPIGNREHSKVKFVTEFRSCETREVRCRSMRDTRLVFGRQALGVACGGVAVGEGVDVGLKPIGAARQVETAVELVDPCALGALDGAAKLAWAAPSMG